MPLIRLIIADDHPVLRQGLRSLLKDSGTIDVVGEASTGREALNLIQELQPDVLILDLEMPDISGLEVAEQLSEIDASVRVLVLSAYDEAQYIKRLLNAGVAGYVLKDEAAKVIVEAVRAVAHGGKGWFSQRITSQLNRHAEEIQLARSLTPREVDVLRLVTEGRTNYGIAQALDISEKTVEKHLDSIYRKLNVRSRTEAAVTAVQEGLL